MNLSSRFTKAVFLASILLLSVFLAHAAAPITNPLCGLEQISNYGLTSGFNIINISGDGNRAIVATDLIDLNTHSVIESLAFTNAQYPILDYDGSRIAFYSNANLSGQNADGSYELYLWDNSVIVQLTNLSMSGSDSPTIIPADINAEGTKIVFGIAPDTGTEIGFYIWEEGLGVRRLVQADTPKISYASIKISSDGTNAVFLHTGNLTGNDPSGLGAFYRINLQTNQTSHILTLAGGFLPEFFVIDGDASRIAFNSGDNFQNLNPSQGAGIYIWDQTAGLKFLNNGSGSPVIPDAIPLGFSDDGNSLLFESAFNPTGENPDGSIEYFMFQWPNTIRQISSKIGVIMFWESTDGLSADGSRAVLTLPILDDASYPSTSSWELFLAHCGANTAVTAPSSLRTSSISRSSINLAWNDNAMNETNYRLERSSNSGSTWTEIASLAANSISYSDTGLSCGTTYQYRVQAYRSDISRYSAYSSTLSATTSICTVATPTNLRASGASYNSVALAWTDNATNETAYYLERKVGQGNWLEIASLAANTVSYMDFGISCGTSYQYRLRSYRSSSSEYSDYSNTLTFSPNCAPLAPSQLRISSKTPATMSLAWVDNAPDESRFSLERSLDGQNWTEVASPNANAVSYTDTGLNCETTYSYRLRSYRAATNGYSSYTPLVSGTTESCAMPAPSNLSLVSKTLTTANLSWTDNSTDESSVLLERSADEGVSWTVIQTLNPNSTSYTDTGLVCGANYSYRLRSYRTISNNYSDYSLILNVSSYACDFGPNLRISFLASGANPITLAWDAIAGVSNYYLELSVDSGSSWTQIASRTSSQLSYSTGSLFDCNLSYQFRVRAFLAVDNQYTGYSNILNFNCAAPMSISNLSVSDRTATSLNLNWLSSVSNSLTKYIETSTDGLTWQLVTGPISTATSYRITELACDTTYYLRLKFYFKTQASYSDSILASTIACSLPSLANFAVSSTQTSITLTWDESIDGETAYYLEKIVNGSWKQEAVLPPDTESYTFNSATCSNQYQYRIRAYRASDDNYTPYTSDIPMFTRLCTPSFDTQIYFDTIRPNSLSISWDDSSDTADSYEIERSLDGQNWTYLGSVPATQTNYSDTTVACATNYSYRLRGYRAIDNSYSDYTNPVRNLTTSACSLVAPSNLSVKSQSNTSTVFQWQDSNLTENYFQVESSLDGVTWSPVGNFSTPSGSTVSNYTLGCNLSLFIRVRAYRSVDTQYSDYSNVLSVSIPACPPLAPTGLQTIYDNGSVNISWTDKATDETNYLVYRANTLIATLDADSTSYVDSVDSSCNQSYAYAVSAYRSDGLASTSTRTVYSDFCPIVLSASTSSLTSIPLSWRWEPNNALSATYYVERSSDNGTTWTQIGNNPASSGTDTNLTCATTYQYRVRANRSAGNYYSAYSNVVSQATLPCAPAAPTNLSLVSVSPTAIEISWTDNASDETAYRVERRSGANSWTQIASIAADLTSYSNTSSLTCSTSYQYRVRAYRASGDVYSSYSNVLYVSSQLCAPPNAPSSLRVSASSYNSVSLAWTDNASNESGYRIERSTDGGTTWAEIKQVAANSSSYTDTSAACETTYYYRVYAYRSSDSQNSSYSNSAVTITGYCLVFTPSNLNLVSVNASSINIAWTDNAPDETAYRIERSSNAGSTWTEIAQIAADSSAYSDMALTCSSNYRYRVRAYRAGDGVYSLYSNTVDASSVLCPPPAAPTNLSTSAISRTSITLSWTDNANSETSYKVERSTDNGVSWTEIYSNSANSTSYFNTGLTCSSSYQYRVRAHRSGDNQYSDYSNVLTVSTMLCLSPAPTNLVLVGTSASSIDIAWVDNASDETAYYLERYDPQILAWQQLAVIPANSTSYSNTVFNCNVAYQYRLRAYRASDTTYSNYSNTVTASSSVCPPPLAPTGLTSSKSSNFVNLSWVDNATDESGYRVEVSTDNGGSWTEITQVAANIVSYKHTGLACETPYQYRVRAYRNYDTSNSDYSNVLSVTTSSCTLAAPSNLQITATSLSSISLAWNDNAPDDNKVWIERSTDGSIWTSLTSVNSPALSYINSSLSCNLLYYYRVRAQRTSDLLYSDYSNVVSSMTSGCFPATPTNLQVSGVTRNQINLSWTDNATDESQYLLYKADQFGTWTLLASLAPNSTSYSHTGLTCNTEIPYRLRVYRSSDNSYSSYSTTLTTSTAACLVAAPSNLLVTATTNTSVSLSWTDNATTESYFMVQESLDGVYFSAVEFPSANVTSFTQTAGLICNRNFYYRVAAYSNTEQGFSAFSNTVIGRTTACNFTAPSNLTLGTTTANSIAFSWTDNASDESNYRVERSTDGLVWTEIAQASANSVSYNNTGLACNTSYRFRVRGYRSSDGGYSAYTNVLIANTGACPALLAPSNLSLTSSAVDNIAMSWTDNASDESNYRVERSANGSTWTEISVLSANITSFSNMGINCGTSYYYRVRAYRGNDSSYSAYSNVISGSSSLCPPPPAPSGLSLSQADRSNITLGWTDNASNETGYRVERSSNGGSTWTEITQLASNSSSYTNSGLSCEVSYQYRVRAYRATDNFFSTYSNVLTASTTACLVNAPSNFRSASGHFSIDLSWVDNSSNETDWELQRSNNSIWQTITTLPSNTVSFTDTGLLCNTMYSYRLRAYNINTGMYSNWVSASGWSGMCPPLVASTMSSTNTETSINLSWINDSTAQTAKLSYSDGIQWFDLGTFNSITTTFVHSGLVCGRSYQYRIQSNRQQDNASLLSASYNFQTAACPPLAAPSAPLVLNASASLVSLQIPTMPASASSMSLERSSDGINWLSLGFVSANYMDLSVSCGMSYQYHLIANRAADGQYSPPSAVSIATTEACPVYVSNIVGIYRAGTWSFVDTNASANPINGFSFGDASWQPLVGDWDGDGVDGVGLYRNGEFVLRSMVAGQVQESRFNFGSAEAGWQAVVGDWNGDGIDSIGLYKDGVFSLSDDNINFHYRFNLGDGRDWLAIAGDWDGNGADGVGLYRNGLWLLVDSAANPMSQAVAYGPEQAAWLPVVGDWNGDGVDTIGLYNNGLWRLRLSSNTAGIETSLSFGQAGDKPIAIVENQAEDLIDFATAISAPPELPSPEPELPISTPEPSAEVTPEVTEIP